MERRITILIAFLILVALEFFYLQPLQQKQPEIKEELFIKTRKLQKYIALTKRTEEIKKELSSTEQRLSEIQKGLISARSESIALVSIQEIIRKYADESSLQVTSMRPLDKIDYSYYVGLPVQITVTGNIKEITEFLKNVVNAPYILTIESINVRVINIRNPYNLRLRGSFVGYMKKRSEK